MLSQVAMLMPHWVRETYIIQYDIGVSQLQTGDEMELILILGLNSTVEVVREIIQ
jgi:hypothetical protein